MVAASAVQVMIYLYALPLTGDRYKKLQLHGQISYQDHTVDVPAAAVDQKFTDRLAGLIRRITADTPTTRVPSAAECRFSDITGPTAPKGSTTRTPRKATRLTSERKHGNQDHPSKFSQYDKQ